MGCRGVPRGVALDCWAPFAWGHARCETHLAGGGVSQFAAIPNQYEMVCCMQGGPAATVRLHAAPGAAAVQDPGNCGTRLLAAHPSWCTTAECLAYRCWCAACKQVLACTCRWSVPSRQWCLAQRCTANRCSAGTGDTACPATFAGLSQCVVCCWMHRHGVAL